MMTAEPGPRPVSLPSLDRLAAEPELFDSLPASAQAALYEAAAALEGRLRARLLTRPPAASAPPAPERAVGVEEATGLLGMSRDYLWRHWKALGGYKDADGRVKFPLSAIQRHVRGRR